jgi:hypothetical protein
MQPIMRSAGIDAAELKARLGEAARRLVEQEIVLPPPAARCACRMDIGACSF